MPLGSGPGRSRRSTATWLPSTSTQPLPRGLPQLLGLHHPPEHHHSHVHVHNVRTTELGRDQGSAPTPCPRPSPGTGVTAPKWGCTEGQGVAQVIPRCSLGRERGRVDGVCILQTLRVCSEIFPGEKQSRDPSPVLVLGIVGRLRVALRKVLLPGSRIWDIPVLPMDSSRVGRRRAQLLCAGNNHNLCWKKLFPNFWALHWTSRSVNLVTKGQNSRGDPVGDEPFGSLATSNENPLASPKPRAVGSRWGAPPASSSCAPGR